MKLIKYFHMVRDFILTTQLTKEHRDRVRKHSPNYILTKEQEAQIREYYGPYVNKVDFSAHNFYTDKTGTFCMDYMPDDLYYTAIDTFYNDWREARFADNKCFYHRMFTGIRQPEHIASRIGGLWYVGDYQPISRQELDALLAKEPEIVVKKAMGSEGGRGVFFIKGTELSTVEPKIKDDILIQRPLVQHARLSAINATSVNTIRIISLLNQEGVKVYSSILRIGINGARVDNASSGGITCGIDADSKLKKYAYKANGDRFERHVDSGVVFDGYELPGFQKCLDAIPALHYQIPHFKLVSWDFAIAEDGEPILVEANLHYGQLDFHQLNNGPIFGEDTHKILKEVFKK